MSHPNRPKGDLTRDVVAVVGSLEFECPTGLAIARDLIHAELADRRPDLVVTTGAAGVEKIAASVADELGIPNLAFAARGGWDGPHGTRATLAKVTAICTRAMRVSCRRSRTQGSGFITDRAEANHKPVRRIVIDNDATVHDTGWTTTPVPEAK